MLRIGRYYYYSGICLQCDNGFLSTRISQKFCSSDCYWKYKSIYCRGENNSNWRGGRKVIKKCLQCSEDFECWSSANRKFCSVECMGKYWMGKNSHAWKGGVTSEISGARHRSKYKNWRKSIFERNNYKCQLCNHNGNENNKLCTHHIYPVDDFPELVYDIDNGITLCRKCHEYFSKNELSFIDFFERITGRTIFI